VEDDVVTDLLAEFEFSTDTARVDRETVHRWLAEDAYWALGRSRAAQDTAIESSLNFSVFRRDSGAQVAYARVLTDGALFAWLCDVYIDPSARGFGLGKALLAEVTHALDQRQIKRVLLATEDAHGLYAQYGFEQLPHAERWMTKVREP
jgi:GNAT superfamily N-acetyltransferase